MDYYKKKMRTLKLHVEMSIDRCIAGPNNEMDWMVFWSEDEKLKEYEKRIHEPVDTILLGRKMTDEFISY
jgi:dihydrofolate reductase